MAKKKKNHVDNMLTPDRDDRANINWYPGHMAKALRQVKEKMKGVDIILEIRDARVPFTSGNNELDKTIGGKQKLVAINKSDLIDGEAIAKWGEWFNAQGIDHIFVNSHNKVSLIKLVDQARKSVLERKVAAGSKAPARKLRMMVIGLPNTGKSTFINTIAGRKVARTADKPGHTQSQQWVTIGDDLELMDTPGIMPPSIASDEQGFWLCAIHAIKDEIVGKDEVALFIINYMLSIKSEAFKGAYGIANFRLSPIEVLDKIGIDRGCVKKKGVIDYERVYAIILGDFRSGALGKVCFEYPTL